jgi:hypothetical protein
MSNRKRARGKVSSELAELKRQAVCPDCGGRATIARNRFDLTVHHAPSCPALKGVTGLHRDSARVVARVAEALGRPLVYEPDGETSAIVRNGVVTASGRPW